MERMQQYDQGGQVAPLCSRCQSSNPSQTSPTQPDPVLSTVIGLNVLKTNKKIFTIYTYDLLQPQICGIQKSPSIVLEYVNYLKYNTSG